MARWQSAWLVTLRCAATFLLGLALWATSVTVHAQADYAAAFVMQTVPGFVETGTAAAVSVTMRNTGTVTWSRSDGDVFLATQLPQDNYYWCIQGNPYGSQSGNRVLLPNDVPPGQEVTFNFTIKPLTCRFAAPAPLQFRMLSQRHGTFGDLTPDPQVVVSAASAFVAQQVPATIPVAAKTLVTVTFRNTSTLTWAPADGDTLAAAGPAGNNTWIAAPVPLPGPVAPNATVTFPFYVVAPTTAGTYNFQWQLQNSAGVPFGSVSPATAVNVVAAGPVNYGGLWWASPAGAESGWGVNFTHQGDTIFATWFTYDASGKGVWMAMSATLGAAATYTGTLYQATGPVFSAVPFNPALVKGAPVGTGTLTFIDEDNATFAYTVNGVAQSKSITREVYGELPTCVFGIQPVLTLAYNYQDLWWAAPAASESGWGVNLTHQGDTVFATWFTYGVDGAPMWLVAGAQKTAQGLYAGDFYRTTGPPFNSVPFDPALVVGTKVGTATFTFTNGNAGTFAYTVDGVTQSKAITREVLVAPGTVCQ